MIDVPLPLLLDDVSTMSLPRQVTGLRDHTVFVCLIHGAEMVLVLDFESEGDLTLSSVLHLPYISIETVFYFDCIRDAIHIILDLLHSLRRVVVRERS